MIDTTVALRAGYALFGETVTIGGQSKVVIVDGGFSEALGMAGTLPRWRAIAADVSSVTVGTAATRGSTSYVVQAREPLAPDEAEVMLVMERR